jgi:predicted RNase H-like nuclease (RuvC/YqgF family)
LPDLTKYDVLLKDLEKIETQVSILKHNNQDAVKRNKELENMLSSYTKENLALQKKIENMQNEIKKLQNDSENDMINSLNLKERETLKVKLKDLISRIDYHLSLDRQI